MEAAHAAAATKRADAKEALKATKPPSAPLPVRERPKWAPQHAAPSMSPPPVKKQKSREEDGEDAKALKELQSECANEAMKFKQRASAEASDATAAEAELQQLRTQLTQECETLATLKLKRVAAQQAYKNDPSEANKTARDKARSAPEHAKDKVVKPLCDKVRDAACEAAELRVRVAHHGRFQRLYDALHDAVREATSHEAAQAANEWHTRPISQLIDEKNAAIEEACKEAREAEERTAKEAMNAQPLCAPTG